MKGSRFSNILVRLLGILNKRTSFSLPTTRTFICWLSVEAHNVLTINRLSTLPLLLFNNGNLLESLSQRHKRLSTFFIFVASRNCQVNMSLQYLMITKKAINLNYFLIFHDFFVVTDIPIYSCIEFSRRLRNIPSHFK